MIKYSYSVAKSKNYLYLSDKQEYFFLSCKDFFYDRIDFYPNLHKKPDDIKNNLYWLI